jgi:hypothetical protein
MEGERTVCSNKSGKTYFLRFNCDFEQLIILFKKIVLAKIYNSPFRISNMTSGGGKLNHRKLSQTVLPTQ